MCFECQGAGKQVHIGHNRIETSCQYVGLMKMSLVQASRMNILRTIVVPSSNFLRLEHKKYI